MRLRKQEFFEEVLDDAMEFITKHDTQMMKEKGKTEWTVLEEESDEAKPGKYEIPKIDIMFSCIHCSYSYYFSIGKTPDGLDIISYYVNVKDCEYEHSKRKHDMPREKIKHTIKSQLEDEEITRTENY